MTDVDQQWLSAFLDDELDERENARVIEALVREGSLRERCDRYQIAAQALRGDRVLPGASRLRERVSAALADEPTCLVAPVKQAAGASSSSLWQMALAASLAVVAVTATIQMARFSAEDATANSVLASQPANSTTPGTMKRMPERTAGDRTIAGLPLDEAPESEAESDASARWVSTKPAVSVKLDQLLVTHQALATSVGNDGLLPYATLAAFGRRR